VITLPSAPRSCGYLRAVVHDRVTGQTLSAPPRPYSLEMPVLASDEEPIATPCGASFSLPRQQQMEKQAAFV